MTDTLKSVEDILGVSLDSFKAEKNRVVLAIPKRAIRSLSLVVIDEWRERLGIHVYEDILISYDTAANSWILTILK